MIEFCFWLSVHVKFRFQKMAAIFAAFVAALAPLAPPIRAGGLVASGGLAAWRPPLPAYAARAATFTPGVLSSSRRCSVVRMEEAEEEQGTSEGLQALGVLTGITVFCLAFFNVLTSNGVDDVVAGNLLLVTLAAAGGGLFFLDGGATQKALEASAVQAVANEEGDLMEQAPLLDPRSVAAASLASDVAAATAAFTEEGVVFVDGLLDEATTTEVRRREYELYSPRTSN